MREEIGPFIVNSSFVNRHANMQINGWPIYFTHDYPNDRRDRQFTYFWYVELTVPGEVVRREMKKAPNAVDENADIKWLSMQEISELLNNRPNEFCHGTIT